MRGMFLRCTRCNRTVNTFGNKYQLTLILSLSNLIILFNFLRKGMRPRIPPVWGAAGGSPRINTPDCSQDPLCELTAEWRALPWT